MSRQNMLTRRERGAAGISLCVLLVAGLLTLPHVPLASAGPQAEPLTLQPVAQCAGATEAVAGRGPYMGHVAVDHQYYCGPNYAYPPEWYAAHIGAYPQYYTAYADEPTTCATYHFRYENSWYCYTGP